MPIFDNLSAASPSAAFLHVSFKGAPLYEASMNSALTIQLTTLPFEPRSGRQKHAE